MPDEALAAKKAALAIRSRSLAAIREYFLRNGFIEVETPVCLNVPALELHIDAQSAGDRWLRTSPEFHMKRMLAAGYEKIFQMGPCFRRGERGARHRPEYTMLEWYRAGVGYAEIMADAKGLVAHVAQSAIGRTSLNYLGQDIELLPRWERITVADAYRQWAGWDPVAQFDAERFDLDLVDKVEPQLPRDVPVILTDYPAEAAALARRKPFNPRVAERWELYIGGMEIANAYSELTDVQEQRARFEACAAARREMGKEAYPIDEEFLAALADMPPAGGIALGVDRLVMLLANAANVDEVIAFDG